MPKTIERELKAKEVATRVVWSAGTSLERTRFAIGSKNPMTELRTLAID